MSGGYNQRRERRKDRTMYEKWKLIERSKAAAGRYVKYYDRIAVVSTVAHDKRSGGTDKWLALTPAAWNAIGKPERALFATDGNGRIGIIPTASHDKRGYKVGAGHAGQLKRMSAGVIFNEVKFEPGIYSATVDDGVLVINTKQKPDPLPA